MLVFSLFSLKNQLCVQWAIGEQRWLDWCQTSCEQLALDFLLLLSFSLIILLHFTLLTCSQLDRKRRSSWKSAFIHSQRPSASMPLLPQSCSSWHQTSFPKTLEHMWLHQVMPTCQFLCYITRRLYTVSNLSQLLCAWLNTLLVVTLSAKQHLSKNLPKFLFRKLKQKNELLCKLSSTIRVYVLFFNVCIWGSTETLC